MQRPAAASSERRRSRIERRYRMDMPKSVLSGQAAELNRAHLLAQGVGKVVQN
jgi:hypothetical protein